MKKNQRVFRAICSNLTANGLLLLSTLSLLLLFLSPSRDGLYEAAVAFLLVATLSCLRRMRLRRMRLPKRSGSLAPQLLAALLTLLLLALGYHRYMATWSDAAITAQLSQRLGLSGQWFLTLTGLLACVVASYSCLVGFGALLSLLVSLPAWIGQWRLNPADHAAAMSLTPPPAKIA